MIKFIAGNNTSATWLSRNWRRRRRRHRCRQPQRRKIHGTDNRGRFGGKCLKIHVGGKLGQLYYRPLSEL